MSTTSSTTIDDYDPLVQHIFENVLGHALGGPKFTTRLLDMLYNNGIVTVYDLMELSIDKLQDFGFHWGQCNLWRLFIAYIKQRFGMDQLESFDSPDDFFFQLSAEDFRKYRMEYNRILQDIPSHPEPIPRDRDRFNRNSFTSSASTAIQQNISQRPQNASRYASFGTFNTPSPS